MTNCCLERKPCTTRDFTWLLLAMGLFGSASRPCMQSSLHGGTPVLLRACMSAVQRAEMPPSYSILLDQLVR